MDTRRPQTITLVEIHGLQKTLASLHLEIQAIRARLAPLAEEMDRAYQEYQAGIRPLYARYVQLDAELRRRQSSSQNERQPQPDEVMDASADKKGATSSPTDRKTPKPAQPRSIGQSQEAVHKDQLLEFLVWVLEDPTDQANLDLMGALTEMNQKQSVRLADMLEQLPADLYGVPMGGDEDDLPGWYERLETWHQALSQRLDRLQKDEATQRRGQKYELWQQYHQGPRVWSAFLDKQRASYRMRVQQLEAELRNME